MADFMENGAIMISTALATAVIVMVYWYVVARKLPKQTELGDYNGEATGKDDNVPRMPD